METFGSYLRGFRESKGIRLEEIASITKIHLHSLELLEADRWEKLPPDPFLRGFIVAYAKYVGLDTKELVQRYYDEMETRLPRAAGSPSSSSTSASSSATEAPSAATPPGELIDHSPTLNTKKLAGAMGILAIVGILGGIVYLGKRATDQSLRDGSGVERQNATESSTTRAPEGKRAPDSTGPTTTTSAPAAPTTAAAPATANHKLTIEGAERTWIKVVVDENAPLEYFLPQGEKVAYEAKDKIKVVLGNATGAKVLYNGKATEGVNFLGTIRSYKFPPEAEFPQDTASKRAEEGTPPSATASSKPRE